LSLDDEDDALVDTQRPPHASAVVAPTPRQGQGATTRETYDRPMVLHGLSVQEYHSDHLGDDGPPSLSASIAKILIEKTPEHARLAHPRLSTPEEREDIERGESLSMSRGTILHKLVLGAGADFFLINAADYRTKDAQAQRAEALALGLIPMLADKLAPYQRAAERIKHRLEHDHMITLTGDSEVAMVFHERANDGTSVRVKCMIDHLIVSHDGTTITAYDLKTCQGASLDECSRAVAKYGYDLQAAAYTSALRHLYPHSREHLFKFLFVEEDMPNACNVLTLDGQAADLGERKWTYAYNMWARCLSLGDFPCTYGSSSDRIAVSPWKDAAWTRRMEAEGDEA
jgi:hypothetical protein